MREIKPVTYIMRKGRVQFAIVATFSDKGEDFAVLRKWELLRLRYVYSVIKMSDLEDIINKFNNGK